MKKILEADLMSLAHRVLQIKNKDDVNLLKDHAQALYEKLSVLAFAERQAEIGTMTVAQREEVEQKLMGDGQVDLPEDKPMEQPEASTDDVAVDNLADEAEDGMFASNDLSELFVPIEVDEREEMDLPGSTTINKMVEEMPEDVIDPVEQDLHDTLFDEEMPEEEVVEEEPVEEAVEETPTITYEELDLPNPATYQKNDLEEITADFAEMPTFERKINNASDKPLSLNDQLKRGLKIGMNDRLGFVRHLFNGQEEDYNRVISQLNTFKTYPQAESFILEMIKPDYNHWQGKEAYEERFLSIVENNYA